MNEFTAALRELWVSSRCPTLREVARRTNGRVSHTAVGSALNGAVLPRWNTAFTLIEALGGDPANYRPLWERADEVNRGEKVS